MPPTALQASTSTQSRKRPRARRNRLALDNMDLVRPVARAIWRRLPPSIELEDLIQAGQIGLLRAAAEYHAGRGLSFRKYAKTMIRFAISDVYRRRRYADYVLDGLEEARDIPAPALAVEVRLDVAQVRRMAARLLTKEQRDVLDAYYSDRMPSVSAVAQQLGIPTSRAVVLRRQAVDILRAALAPAA